MFIFYKSWSSVKVSSVIYIYFSFVYVTNCMTLLKKKEIIHINV